MGIDAGDRGAVKIEQLVDAPADNVAAYIGDFQNAKDWMVGVESVEKLADDEFRLKLDSPIGKISPEARIIEHRAESIRWIYTSTIEGGGLVEVAPGQNGSCLVSYTGDFRLKGRILGRLAKAAGMARFARMNGERSLSRLKHLMEARRY